MSLPALAQERRPVGRFLAIASGWYTSPRTHHSRWSSTATLGLLQLRQGNNPQTFALRRNSDKWLLFEHQRRSAYSLPFQVHYHFDTVCDFYQRNAFIHPIVLTVEGHRPFNLA